MTEQIEYSPAESGGVIVLLRVGKHAALYLTGGKTWSLFRHHAIPFATLTEAIAAIGHATPYKRNRKKIGGGHR